MTIIARPCIVFMLVWVLIPGLAGGVSAMGSTAMFDTALEDTPCEIVTAQMVANALDVPEDSLEQSNVIASQCSYELEDEGDETLGVEVSINAYDTDEGAAEEFRDATRSMSSEEIADTMAALTETSDGGDAQDTDTQQTAADGIASGLARTGIQFEDVDGLADQARFDTGDGTLQLQQGNLRIKLRAFHGAAMPLPDELTSDSMMKALLAWQKDTMPERRQQALTLAKLALANL